MAKNRVRPKQAKNGKKKWARGQSSSSNPATRKYRDAAKSKSMAAFQAGRGGGIGGTAGTSASPALGGSGPNKLTAENLLKHESLMVGARDRPASDEQATGDDTATLGQTFKTFDTFASDWTQCSNVSFSRIMQKFNGTNAQHREMLAILAAVTEIVKEKGSGEETSTEYFAALLSTLELQDSSSGLAAALSLLSMVIKTVPQAVLQAKFSAFSKLLLDQLVALDGGEDASDFTTSMLRSVIGCLSVALRAQGISAWKQTSAARKVNSPTMQVYKALLTYVTHLRPKVRKAAQYSVCAVLKGSHLMTEDYAPEFHPASAVTTDFCIEKLSHTSDPTAVLHTLLLLKEVVAVFPQAQVKSVCDSVLSLMRSKSHPHLNTCCMQVLFGLFNSRPSQASLPAELNAKLVTALYDYKPSVNDPKAIIAWLTVQQEAIINLCAADADLCLAHLPQFFSEAKKGWTTDHSQVAVATTTALKAICNECIKPNIENFADRQNQEKLKKAFSHVLDGLGYQYHNAWAQVLHLLAVVFDVAGSACQSFLSQYLPALADRRAADNFTFVNELDYVIGKAVRRMGPRIVLSEIDLQITGEESNYDFPRSWLLPVLRDNVANTELSFFIDYFYPLAEKCRLRSQKCLNFDDKIGKKIYETLDFQIWSLLPGFCNAPIDLPAFHSKLVAPGKRFSQLLGTQLQARKDLRIDILSSLRQLIAKNLDNKENREVMAARAQNYLPILFNLYLSQPVGSEERGQRLAVLETVKVYLQIAPEPLARKMFHKVLDEYTKISAGFEKEALMDIIQTLLIYQDRDGVQKLFDIVEKNVSSDNHVDQKKAYKILEEICRSEGEECAAFRSDNLDRIQEVLLKSLSSSSPASKKFRLRCLIHVIRKLNPNNKAFAIKVVPEAVLCIKEVNKVARSEAFTLVVCIGEAMIKWNADLEPGEALKEYLEALFAGLAGSPFMINCSLLAVTRVFYEFRDVFPASVSEMMVNNVCLLLTSQAREVVGSSLSFLRVFVTVNPVFETSRFVETIMKALSNMTEDCKRHFRIKSRFLLERLVKKFGYDLVSGIVSKEDTIMQKRLNNIRKAQARKARADEMKVKGGADDDSDDDSEFRVRSTPKNMEEIMADLDDSENDEMDHCESGKPSKAAASKKKRRQQQTFISENDASGGNIVDFLDPSAAQNVTSVKPKTEAERQAKLKAKKDKDKNGGFKIASDGRLIIQDSDEDDSDGDGEEAEMRRRRGHFMEDSEDEEGKEDGGGEKSENTFRALVSTSSSRKRKLGGSVASSRRTNEPSMKYQAGGSGIHRPLTGGKEKPPASSEFGSEYRSKKARGDVKRKGKPDPYAYVPLEKSALNKRKRAKFEGKFKNVVKAAQAGADQGAKGKSKHLAKQMKNMKV